MLSSELDRAMLSPTPGTVPVTLKLTDAASENMKSIVKSLCGLLCVPEPQSYHLGGEPRKELTATSKREARPSTGEQII